uniref:Reverse transcriptase domain-containing protein n=1 Tax=Salmo trutta TaxID=8032 RepID=A0A674AJ45_SALTR
MSNKICSFSLQTVSVEEVLNLLKSLPDGKSTGYDLMDNFLLRCTAPQIAVPLRYIFNWSLEKWMFANVWKHAKLCPIPKDCKEPATPANSRPISLLPTLSKILEGIVSRQIWEYMENNDLITANQHAYRKNHSTTTALVDMTDQWLNAMDNGKFVGVLFLDFSAAFDLVDHEIILTKLMHYGFKEVALNWVQSYLTDRKQSTYINGSFSSPHALNCGIPQGSCLGPLLYLIYTNDLSYALAETQATVFADDTTIYAAGQSVQQVQQALQGDLENIREWVCQNKLVLNTKKTKVMLVCSTRKRPKQHGIQLSMGGVQIEEVAETKLLGVQLDNCLSWSSQITNLCKKIIKTACIIRRIAKYLPGKILKQITQALIESQVNYCSVVWGNASSSEVRRLQIAQNKAARIVLRWRYGF